MASSIASAIPANIATIMAQIPITTATLVFIQIIAAVFIIYMIDTLPAQPRSVLPQIYRSRPLPFYLAMPQGEVSPIHDLSAPEHDYGDSKNHNKIYRDHKKSQLER